MQLLRDSFAVLRGSVFGLAGLHATPTVAFTSVSAVGGVCDDCWNGTVAWAGFADACAPLETFEAALERANDGLLSAPLRCSTRRWPA